MAIRLRMPLPPLFALVFFPVFSCSAAPWKRHVIDAADPANQLVGADGVRLGDINGDGRLDVVTGWEEGNQIRVCLQPPPEMIREPWQAITVGRVESPEDAVFADLDGDGRLDVVSATEGKDRTVYVHWAPLSPTPITDESAWITDSFPATAGKQRWMYTLPLDVDGDGDTDLIVGSKDSGATVTWLENPGPAAARDLSLWTARQISEAGWIMSLELMEHNGERFLIYSDRKGRRSGIYRVPLSHEAPWFGKPELIGAGGEEVMFLTIVDYDGDGHPDIVAAIRPHEVRVFLQPENPEGKWTEKRVLAPIPSERFGSTKAVGFADMNGDGNPQFVITCEGANGEKEGVFLASPRSEWTSVSGSEGSKFDRLELLDLDGDGDLDIITCEESSGLGVVWYENPSR